MSFRREKYVPKGGPDGGDGGDGGSVIILAREGVNSLAALSNRKHWLAERGDHGRGANCRGRNGADLEIWVPPGTVVRDARGGYVLKDLTNDGDAVNAALGGRGGRGNVRFKSATNQAPRHYTRGGDGQRREVILELKVIADAGLIGKPNAGKSTLLSRVSHARPEIADYPFTTKYPNLGQIQFDHDTAFVIADIPGLIEGAHAGVGLGHEFLRHVERTRVLVHLVEPCPTDGSDPVENYFTIREELQQYDASLAERPEIIVITKSELPGAAEVQAELAARTGRDILLISAATGAGLKCLLQEIVRHLSEISEPQSPSPSPSPSQLV